MTSIPNITHINVTDTLSLECTFVGNPIPGSIVWTRNGNTLGSPTVTITETVLYTAEFGSSLVSTLELTNVGTSDGNDYVCSSSNSKGSTEGKYNVSVCRKFLISNLFFLILYVKILSHILYWPTRIVNAIFVEKSLL